MTVSKDFKLSNIHYHQRFQAFQHNIIISSRNRQRDNQIHNKQIGVLIHAQSKCFDNSSGIVSSEESA